MKTEIKSKIKQLIAFSKEAYTVIIKKTKQLVAMTTITILLLLGSVSAWQKANEYLIPFWTDFLVMHTDSFEIKIKQVKAEETPIDEWIKNEWEKAGAKWSEVKLVVLKESGASNDAWNCNMKGSSTEKKTYALDAGRYQTNSIHKIPLTCLVDPKCSTTENIKIWKQSGWCPWVQAKKLGLCK